MIMVIAGMCKREFSTVFFEVCDKLFKENCEVSYKLRVIDISHILACTCEP